MPRALQALADGLRLRCPACHAGRMTRAWWAFFSQHERCPRCDIPFVPGRGENVGGVELAVYVSALVGLLGYVALVVATRAPWWVHVAWVILFGLLLPVLSYRQFRGVWIALMYAAAPWGGEGDAPRVGPAEARAWPWEE